MQICSEYTSCNYSIFFTCLEYVLIIILFLLYLKKINDLIRLPNILYDKIDLIIIYLSALQLFFFLIRLIKNYNIFSVLISINKFSQNLLICTLLLIYILSKYEKRKTTILKYFLVTLLILDILIFLIEINDSQPFDIKDKETIDHLIISFFCLILDSFLCYKSFVNKNVMNFENSEVKKLDNIINKEDNLIEEQNNNKENNEFLNTIYYQNLTNINIIISIYFYTLITFLISYFVDIFLYFSYKSGIQKNNNINNDTIYNNTNFNETINNHDNNTINNIYIYNSQNDDNQCNFLELILCFIYFLLRDILPYLVIFLMFFYYKLKYYHRSSF